MKKKSKPQTNSREKTYHIGHADQEGALITAPTGHDVIVIRRLAVERPYLPEGNHISFKQWQTIIDAVDVALRDLNPNQNR
jgi:hypothetical protein